MKVIYLLWTSCMAAWVVAGACPAYGQADPRSSEGIAVSGVGTVKSRPDLVRIEVRLQSKAEITDDALVKYRDSRRRVFEAIDGLKQKNVRVVEQNLSLSAAFDQAAYQAMMNGMAMQSETAQPTQVSANLHIELSGMRDLPPEDMLKAVAKVLDTAKDAGGQVGPSQADIQMGWNYGRPPQVTTVKFVLRDFQQLREQAYEQAVADARTRAQRLAKLSGLKFGRVRAVQEVQVSGDNPEVYYQNNPYYYNYGYQQQNIQNRNEITTDNFAEIPVNVRLMVRFEIAEPDAKDAAVSKAR